MVLFRGCAVYPGGVMLRVLTQWRSDEASWPAWDITKTPRQPANPLGVTAHKDINDEHRKLMSRLIGILFTHGEFKVSISFPTDHHQAVSLLLVMIGSTCASRCTSTYCRLGRYFPDPRTLYPVGGLHWKTVGTWRTVGTLPAWTVS